MQSSQYSDMKIKDSNGHIYNAHKLVVCTQSDFFKNALKENTYKVRPAPSRRSSSTRPNQRRKI